MNAEPTASRASRRSAAAKWGDDRPVIPAASAKISAKRGDPAVSEGSLFLPKCVFRTSYD